MTELATGAGRSARLLVALVVLAALAASFGPQAPAAGAATELEVVAGYGGFHVPGRAVPVQVTISADRLLRGDLVVLARPGADAAVSRAVEVPGGSVKRFVLVLPSGVADRAGDGDVRAELRSGSRVLARGETRVRVADGQELVGLLPASRAGRAVPGPAPLAVDAGLARFVALDLADVGRGAAALDALSAIGIAPDELAGLTDSARASLFGWVRTGGRLLVSGAPGHDVPALPAAWQPGPGGRAAAGRGEIRLVGDAMAAGRWAGLVEPTPKGRRTDRSFFSSGSVANAVARDAGLHLPRLTTLLAFLGIYVLAVGPLTSMVLRRRRRPDLAWVVVPVLAVVFTAGSYVAGSGTRNGSRVAHSTVLEVDADGAVATTYVGLTRRGAGTARLGFPEGWTVEQPGDSDGFGRVPPATDLGGDGPEARLPLDVGQFGLVRASGPVAPGGRLEVTASAEGDTARGTIRNRFPYALEEVNVYVDGGVASVGRLEAGEERTWSAGVGVAHGVADPFFSFPGDSNWNGAAPRDSAVNVALWQEARSEMGANGFSPGTATAVGWTRGYEPRISVDGGRRAVEGRTAIVARAVVEPAGTGPLSGLAVRREVVRGPFPSLFGMEGAPGADDGTVMRFTLPPGERDPARGLVLRSTFPMQSVEVWRDGVWQVVGGGGAFGKFFFDGGVRVLPAVPEGQPLLEPPTTLSPRTTLTMPPPPRVAPPVPRTAPAAPPDGFDSEPVPMPVPVPDFPPGFDGRQGITDVAVPGEAVSDGVVFVRVRLQFFDGGPNPATITLGEA